MIAPDASQLHADASEGLESALALLDFAVCSGDPEATRTAVTTVLALYRIRVACAGCLPRDDAPRAKLGPI